MQGKNNISLWARCFGQINNSFGHVVLGNSTIPLTMVDRFMDFLLLAVVDDVSCVETTFMFNLHLSSFFVLSMYMISFLPSVVLE